MFTSTRFLKRALPFLLLGLMALVIPALASLETVADLFQAGQYDDARQSILEGNEGARPGEEALWRSRLAANPVEAIELLESHRLDERLPAFIRQRMTLELAEIYFTQGNHRGCLEILTELLDAAEQDTPGEAYLLSGMSYRLLGDFQSAREMLASIRPGDPAFVQARFQLGDIGLKQADASLAERYFVSGLKETSGEKHPDLQAGLWASHRALGNDSEANAALQKLEEQFPSSLALLEIKRLLQAEAEEIDSRAAITDPGGSIATRPMDNSGRYALQFGAFSDRGLALDFVKRMNRQIPGLRIDEIRDNRGQFLYKVRAGSFVNPALARTEAAKMERDLDIEVIVSDLSNGSGD